MNTLEVQTEDGSLQTIYVWDIINSALFRKTFIIYTFEDNSEDVYESILEENDNSYTLSPIVREEEKKYIDVEVERLSEELQIKR